MAKRYLCNKNQKTHTFYINILIELYCLRYVSNIQVLILMQDLYIQFYGISFMQAKTTNAKLYISQGQR